MIQNGHIGIPFNIVNLWVFGQQVIHHAEYEILYFRIAHVEYYLCTATSQYGITLGCLDNPVGMSLKELAGGVGHLGFNPDTKLDAMFLGIAEQTLNAFRQLILVNNPVAQ